jgi:tetratricopeptide (TPR) repeat protein
MLHRPAAKSRLKVRRGQPTTLVPLKNSRPTFLLDGSAALLFASSITMVTDFSRRVIGANPDELGIFSVSVQAIISVAATGAFTKAGWQWIESLLAKTRFRSTSPSWLRLKLSVLFFAIVCVTWLWVPAWLARYSDYWGMAAAERGDGSRAIGNLERSVALDPRYAAPHYNLGELFERSFQFDQAISHYKQAIALNRRDLRTYSNLARLLLLTGDPRMALRIINQAPIASSQDKQGLAAIYAQKGLSEFELGFALPAIRDAELSEKNYSNAASYCLLAKIYDSTKDLPNAHTAWDQFKRMQGEAEEFKASAPPDCKLRAEDFNAKN